MVLKHNVLVTPACEFLSAQITLSLTHLAKKLRPVSLTVPAQGSYHSWFCCSCCSYFAGGGDCGDSLMFLSGKYIRQRKCLKMLLQIRVPKLNNSDWLIISHILSIFNFPSGQN